MFEQIQSIGIQVCQWDTAPFFLFSDNVFSNLIYYSHLFPVITAVLFGILVLMSDRKKLVNKVLFFIMLMFTFWALLDLSLWAMEKIDYIMFAWSFMTYLEILIYLGCYYLAYLFVFGKDIPFKSKAFWLSLALPVIFLAPTSLTLSGFDFTNCEREALEGPLWQYIYVIELITIVGIINILFKSFKTIKDKALRKQNILIILGISLFLLTFSYGNIVGSFSVDWSIAQYGLFGMPIFIGFLAYLVARYQRFSGKIFTTQILIGALWILIFSLLFIQDIQLVRIVVGFTFVISLVFGSLLNIAVIKEIRQRKEIEVLAKGLTAANTRLQELDKQKTEFISFATHQLRSPITSIKGNASIILEGDAGPVPPMAKEIIQTIYTSIKTMGSVVEDYLNVSRIELGTMKYVLSDMDFKKIAQEVVNEQKPTIEAKGLAWTFSADESQIHKIKADPDKFKQVLMNIVDNSVKYTPSGSLQMSLTKNVTKGTICFKVVDTGVGISPKVMPLLFQKFSRAPHANEANIHGTGLGLFIAKEIVNGHGGRIWAESDGEGKGSRFYVELPEVK